MKTYSRAWKILRCRIEEKTSWGKEELKKLMLECLEQATDEEDFADGL